MITICFTYFRSLGLANLEAALYSVRQQDLTYVDELVIVDNNTVDQEHEIQSVIDLLAFPVPVRLLSIKHGDPSKTHSWSTNVAIRATKTPWILVCRADYILDFELLSRFFSIVTSHPYNWNGFVTGNVYHLRVDLSKCEQTKWRVIGPQALLKLRGIEENYTCIDSGVWLTNRQVFDQVNGLEETLTVWGHAQTHFQHKLYRTGTEFVRIPEVMFYHPRHSAPRDINVAHQQLQEQGINLKELWERYPGVQPY